jgi:hypothetical protein
MGDRTSIQRASTERWTSSLALLAAGGVSIVAGGLAAAVTGPTGWEHGSWVAAFLVLVAGVAQIGVGAGQALLTPVAPAPAFAAVQTVSWNASCAAVIAGTLLSSPIVVSIGSALLLVALGMSLFAVNGSGNQPRVPLWSYRALLIVLLVSIPVGITLSWARS